MHPRNRHLDGYDFQALSTTSATLKRFLRTTPAGTPSIDFGNPAAVKALNRALLMHHYEVRGWSLPEGYLCPPVPGRVDYLHHIADLLASGQQKTIPRGPGIRILDIGTGANLIYPLLGHAEYGWRFLGSDIDPVALENAQAILAKNPALTVKIEVREQENVMHILKGLLRQGEHFDVSICNPPFHNSPGDVLAVNKRKWNQLGQNKGGAHLNFGGQPNELWCNGGERGFVETLIQESAEIPKRCLWFTTLLSKEENLKHVERALTKAKVQSSRIIPMQQGQKHSRLVAWTFLNNGEQVRWRKQYWASTAETAVPTTEPSPEPGSVPATPEA